MWSGARKIMRSSKERPPTRSIPASGGRQLNHQHGLFKVVEGLYQVRGIDLSNMTILEGDTGLIVVDPLLSVETAKAALDLYYQHRPRRPLVAVIYTHTHAAHWAGVQVVTTQADVAPCMVPVLAPQ